MLEESVRKTACEELMKQLKSMKLGSRFSLEGLLGSSPAFVEVEGGYVLVGGGAVIEDWDLRRLDMDLRKKADRSGFCIHEGEDGALALYRRLKWWDLPADMVLERIELGSSGFLGPASSFCYDGSILRFVELDLDRKVRRTLELNVSDCDRKRLESLLHRVNVFAWKRDYVDEEILDGTQWSFAAVFSNGYAIASGGSNAFPDGYETLEGGMLRLIIGE